MKNPGILYILINPSLSGLLKIGKTCRSAEDRAKELSNVTGVPTPFIVAFEEAFEDCDIAEKYVHELLRQKGCRLNDSREFFSISLKEAVRVLLDAKSALSVEGLCDSEMERVDRPIASKGNNLGRDIFQQGINCLEGLGDTIKDYKQAHKLLKRAVTLGSVDACLKLSEMYLFGIGCKQDFEKPIEFTNEAIRLGGHRYYAKLARLYSEEHCSMYNLANAEKCWKAYFTYLSTADQYIDLEEAKSSINSYMHLVINQGIPANHIQQCSDILSKSPEEILLEAEASRPPRLLELLSRTQIGSFSTSSERSVQERAQKQVDVSESPARRVAQERGVVQEQARKKADASESPGEKIRRAIRGGT